jgi:hypothetical protein
MVITDALEEVDGVEGRHPAFIPLQAEIGD